MKGLSFIAIFILVTNCAISQTDKVQNIHSIRAAIVGISYSYEQSLSQKTTLNIEVALAYHSGSDSIFGNYWFIAPQLRIEPRFYYNYIKRKVKGKNVINNSANYISLSLDYQLGTSIGYNANALQTFSIVPKWGFKRAIGNHFNFDFATGFGIRTSENEDWHGVIALDLRFGYTF